MSLLRTLFPLLLLLLLGTAQVQAEPGLPSAASVQQSLDNLDSRKLPEADSKAMQLTLQKTLDNLQALEQARKALDALHRQLGEAPRQVTAAQRELAQLQPIPPDLLASRYSQMEITRLESELNQRLATLDDWQRGMAMATNTLINAQTRPERAQTEISANQTRSQEIRNQLKAARDKGQPLAPEQVDMLNSELALLEALSQLRREELAGNSVLQDLGNSQRALYGRRIELQEADILALQNTLNTRRREVSEETVAQVSQDQSGPLQGSLLKQQADLNLQLSNRLLKATERANALTRKNIETRQQLDSLRQSEQALEAQIDALKGSLLLTRILYQQKQQLPRLSLDSNLANEIADLRLFQFELGQRRAELLDPQQYIELQLAAGQLHIDAELRDNLVQVLSSRLELIDRLNSELGNLLNQAITLQLNEKQLVTTASSLRRTLDEQMFWVASNKPLTFDWLRTAPQRLQQQLDALPLQSSLNTISNGLLSQPLLLLPLLLLVGGLLASRSWLHRQLESLDHNLHHHLRDNQLVTPLAILCHVLLVLPLPVVIAACGVLLIQDPQESTTTFGIALLKLAQAVLVFGVSYRLLGRQSVAERHFQWEQQRVQEFYAQVRRLGLVVMPLVLVVSIAERQFSAMTEDVSGTIIALCGFLLMSLILWRIMLRQPPLFGSRIAHSIASLLLVGLPLALVVLVAFGYYYTALKLTGRLLDTLYLITLWMVLQSTIVRGLAVAARRLAWQRAVARRQQIHEGADGGEVIEEPTLGLEQINQQSLRLVRLALLVSFSVLFYWVWADLLAVFTYLDSVTLYQYSTGEGETLKLVPLSLGDLLGAGVVLGITLILASNLPGLLEILVLSRMKLAQGSAYATTTLLSYVIVATGLVSTLSTLGVSWDKLQWLVAALSVGLGFGLQEIFANFISGLIILFERPVRIGDTVTIAGLSGTVSKIRIRATTITDFERKEIIVPNKAFITSQLVNWSLTDTVTRVTIRVGVAYGSDLALVRRLLLEIAHSNARVLAEPEPQVLFLNFGASTLDHELRVHVRELVDRNPAIDEINREIDQQFREHGIEIAFAQMDVTIKNLNGPQEATLTSNQPLPKPSQDAGEGNGSRA